MKKLMQRIKCLFGFHAEGHYIDYRIVAINRDTHAIEGGNVFGCPACKKVFRTEYL